MKIATVHKNIILILACLAQFMVILDLTIVNVALPTIQKELGLNQSALQWVVIAYGLLFGGFLLLGGRLGDLLGRRRVLVAGLTLFSTASLAAGLADSSVLLIAARAVQGFGAALIAPSALSILAAAFTEGKARNSALGIFGAVGGASASVGVLASGLLTDGPGWPWIFYINVPIGLFLMGLALKYLPHDTAKGHRRFNAAGAITVTAGLVLFVYGLNRGVSDGWGSSWTLGSFVSAIALLILFVRIESRARAPLVTVAVFKNRASTAAMTTGFFAFGAFFSFIFTTTLFLQQHLNYSPTQTGLTWLITSVTAFIVAGLTGATLAAKFGIRRLLITGLSLMTVAMLWLVRIPLDVVFLRDIFPALVMAGVAVGLLSPSVQIGALSGVKPKMFGLVSGLVETMRELGGVMAIAAVSTVLVAQNGATLHGFHAAFLVIAVASALGLVAASVSFRRQQR